MLFDAATENADMLESPAVLEVTVTVLVLEVAVTPAPTGHRLIAAARFEARVVVFKLLAKVPVVELPHALVPLDPALVALQFKACPPPLVSVPPKVAAPSPAPVTVTPLSLALAVKPTLGNEVLQELIAAARFVASVVVLALFT